MLCRFGLCVVLCALSSLGCTSIRTTSLNRSENDQLNRNEALPLKGVPVMLKVPTHIEVAVYERDFWKAPLDGGKLTAIDQPVPVRFVKSELKRTEKMFLVDPKRPAAGTGVYGFTFSSDGSKPKDPGHGYLSSAKYTAQDETLIQSAKLVNSIADLMLLGNPAAALKGNDESKNGAKFQIHTTDRVIAFKRFDINSCTFESDVQSFLDQYLNNCHNCAEAKY